VLAGITDGDCAVELGAASVAELPAEPAVAPAGSKSETRHQRTHKPDFRIPERLRTDWASPAVSVSLLAEVPRAAGTDWQRDVLLRQFPSPRKYSAT